MRQPGLGVSEEEFSGALVALQLPLRGYIRSLLPGSNDVDDVLQEVNVLLWERRDQLGGAEELEENLRPFAFRCAYFKALAWRRDAARKGYVGLCDSLVQSVAEASEAFWDVRAVNRLAALQDCVGRLTPEDRNLLMARYKRQDSLAQLAERVGKAKGAVYMAISRLRGALRACIQEKLDQEGIV
jgi:RNA polymerase sigma-70 factor (ECF subfamily)